MAKQKTKQYLHILWVVDEIPIQKSTQATQRKFADYLVKKLEEQYPGCPGRMALQTYKISDETGPTDLLSEEVLEIYNDWHPHPQAVIPVLQRTGAARKAEW